MEGKDKLLHGTLEVTIFDATPYTPSFPFNCVLGNGKSAYVVIKIDNKKVAKTTHERDRVWNQTFQILCAHSPHATITLTLKTSCSTLGTLHINAQKILNETSFIDGFVPLLMENGKPNPRELNLRFMLWFKPALCEPGWSEVVSRGNFHGLKNGVTFNERSNCRVVLYQDAHHTCTFHPPMDVCGSRRNLWEDVYKAIEGAKHLVYIAGWSFNPKLVLVRDPETKIPHAKGVKIGELLIRKAEEGVAIRIMLWNDETSFPIIKNKGVMKTHDEDAFAYFKNTKVVCKLCPRLHKKFPTVFTHHQKTITVDARATSPASTTEREIISFVGGLDLCDGRYDTEQHSLFRTLNATQSHRDDFYQTNIPGASLLKGGPRVPWHDVHACVIGDAARDVLTNFEQRWCKQCDPSLLVDTTTNIRNIREVVTCDPSEMNWNVQVFRSIDHVSVTGLPKNLRVERSIHDAYVEAIRKAERFIYVENQYFIGGGGGGGCGNLIPVEIALKVVSKIKAKERFGVYVLIPMWPEGVLGSEVVEDILYWTRETMGMMYKLIGDAIKESGESSAGVVPTDYLNFFWLGNREEKREGEFVAPYLPHPQTQYWNAQRHRRFMIYIHSKLMIVDDLYLLIGSANINQRSMDGQRDTEIAIGCYQLKSDTNPSDGIYSYRMSLWYEHIGHLEESFQRPQSLECVRKVRSIGEKMWKIYESEQVVDMEGVHLLTYPINVTQEGYISDIVDGGTDLSFPDTKSMMKGRRSKILPPIFTT